MTWLISKALMEDYASSRSLRGPVAESLAENFSDGEQFAQLNIMPTPQLFSHNDIMTDLLSHSLFGPMSARLTESRGAELLTLYLEDFLAKTSAQPEKEQESQAKNQGSGLSSLASLAKYDPDTCSWKIPQYSLLGDSELFLETWPRWGLMRDGECWEQKTLVRRIKETGSGLWRTPTVGMLNADRAKDPEYGARKAAKGQTITLADQVRNPNVLWHTPTCDDSVNRKLGGFNSRGEPKLSAQVLLPTPTANPYGSCQGGSAGRDGQKNRPSLNTMAAKNMWPTPSTKGLDGGSNSRKAAKARGMWPTPRAADANKNQRTQDGVEREIARKGGPQDLIQAIKTWPTPRANDGEKRGNFDLSNPRNGLPAAVKKFTSDAGLEQLCEQLNPDFVEWLMGWPVGWTDLDAIKPATADWEHGEPLDVPRTSTDTPNRKHRLMCIGNGQVPQCAAEAWRLLK